MELEKTLDGNFKSIFEKVVGEVATEQGFEVSTYADGRISEVYYEYHYSPEEKNKIQEEFQRALIINQVDYTDKKEFEKFVNYYVDKIYEELYENVLDYNKIEEFEEAIEKKMEEEYVNYAKEECSQEELDEFSNLVSAFIHGGDYKPFLVQDYDFEKECVVLLPLRADVSMKDVVERFFHQSIDDIAQGKNELARELAKANQYDKEFSFLEKATVGKWEEVLEKRPAIVLGANDQMFLNDYQTPVELFDNIAFHFDDIRPDLQGGEADLPYFETMVENYNFKSNKKVAGVMPGEVDYVSESKVSEKLFPEKRSPFEPDFCQQIADKKAELEQEGECR